MRTLEVTAVWESRHTIDVEDDYVLEPGSRDEEVVGQLDCRHAALVDWVVDDD